MEEQQDAPQIVVTNSNAASVGVSGSVLIPVNNGNNNYFQPREDTGNYDENMKPWEADGQNYSFACCTEYSTQAGTKKKGCCCGVAEKSQNVETKWVHTVYHKTGSNRIIVKKREAASSLEKAKNNPMTKWAVLVAILGILLAVSGAAYPDDGEVEKQRNMLIIAGGIMIIVSFFLCIFGFQGKNNFVRDQEMVTQSIPIKSIFFVERTVSQKEEAATKSCCGGKEKTDIYSDISIGYNRSNLSSRLQTSASKKDFVTFSLMANQAYNLHQYINCIIDGTHPQTSNGNDNDNALPGN